jgi:hypothetical protein
VDRAREERPLGRRRHVHLPHLPALAERGEARVDHLRLQAEHHLRQPLHVALEPQPALGLPGQRGEPRLDRALLGRELPRLPVERPGVGAGQRQQPPLQVAMLVVSTRTSGSRSVRVPNRRVARSRAG